MNLEIKIKEGLGDVRFGMSVDDVTGIMGRADEVEEMDSATDEPTTVLHYNGLGITLFFEGDKPSLSCIDISNTECTLFGERVFDLDERALVRLMVNNGYPEQDVDDDLFIDRRVGFIRANVDFYYDDGSMSALIIGA